MNVFRVNTSSQMSLQLGEAADLKWPPSPADIGADMVKIELAAGVTLDGVARGEGDGWTWPGAALGARKRTGNARGMCLAIGVGNSMRTACELHRETCMFPHHRYPLTAKAFIRGKVTRFRLPVTSFDPPHKYAQKLSNPSSGPNQSAWYLGTRMLVTQNPPAELDYKALFGIVLLRASEVIGYGMKFA